MKKMILNALLVGCLAASALATLPALGSSQGVANGDGHRCTSCNGSGKCWHCGGRGSIACGVCNGSGRFLEGKCLACNGQGSRNCSGCRGSSGVCSSCNGSGT